MVLVSTATVVPFVPLQLYLSGRWPEAREQLEVCLHSRVCAAGTAVEDGPTRRCWRSWQHMVTGPHLAGAV